MHARDVGRRAFERTTERRSEAIERGAHRSARYLERIEGDAVELPRECDEPTIALRSDSGYDLGGTASHGVVDRQCAVEELALIRDTQGGSGATEAERRGLGCRDGRVEA